VRSQQRCCLLEKEKAMSEISIGADGYYHPNSEEQIRELILRANEKHLQVRVRGSGH